MAYPLLIPNGSKIKRPGKSTDPCRVCGIENRHFSPSGKVYSYCKSCKNTRDRTYPNKPRPEYQKAWRAANVDKCNMYRETRRARERGAYIEDISPYAVFTRYNGICGICNKAVDRERYQMDHIIPLAKGGLHCYDNIQLSHKSCNMRKGSKIYV